MFANNDIVYRVNAADKICFTNKQYDEFAAANEGNAALTAAVLHRPIWDFISDPTTRHLYEKVIERVRDDRSIRFSFRCDSPACRRKLELTVVSVEDGGVEFRTRTISEETRATQALLQHRAGPSESLLRMCAWCNAIEVDGVWVEVEEAARRLRLFEHSYLPTLTHGMCEPCFMRIKKTLSNA
ncbi:MAG: hypothetical protein FJ404_03330 [Verrucomicrobia bacterium]|nr:hypothetical protein [Verrucomicrobiota bacterium]